MIETPPLVAEWTYSHSGNPPDHPPVVVGDSLVLVSGYTDLTCLRVADGSVKWSTFVDDTINLLTNRVLVDEQRAYATHYDHDGGEIASIRAWDLLTGDEMWRQSFGVQGELRIRQGIEVGPQYVYGTGDDGHFFALNKHDGAFAFDNHMRATPRNLTYADGILYATRRRVYSLNNGISYEQEGEILALDPATGDSLWAISLTPWAIIQRPIVRSGIMYAGIQNVDLVANYVAIDLSTREQVWTAQDVEPLSHEFVNDTIYARGRGHLIAVNANSGAELWRSERLPTDAGDRQHAYHNGYVYYPHAHGLRIIDSSTGEIAYVLPPQERQFSEATAARNLVFVQAGSILTAFRPYVNGDM